MRNIKLYLKRGFWFWLYAFVAFIPLSIGIVIITSASIGQRLIGLIILTTTILGTLIVYGWASTKAVRKVRR